MIIIPELKKIAGLNHKIGRIVESLAEKLDVDGLDFQSAYLISGCKVVGKHLVKDGEQLDNYGLTDDLYYCNQYTGYCEDDYMDYDKQADHLIAHGVTVQEWIPASDPPKDDLPVLVTCGRGYRPCWLRSVWEMSSKQARIHGYEKRMGGLAPTACGTVNINLLLQIL